MKGVSKVIWFFLALVIFIVFVVIILKILGVSIHIKHIIESFTPKFA